MSLPVNAGLFNISINNLGGLTPSQSSAFDDAIAYWESYLIGVQSSFDHSIIIDLSGAPLVLMLCYFGCQRRPMR